MTKFGMANLSEAFEIELLFVIHVTDYQEFVNVVYRLQVVENVVDRFFEVSDLSRVVPIAI